MHIRRGIKSKLQVSFLKNKHQLALFFVAFITIFSFIGSEVFAVPNVINYQGRLRDNTGTPITNSTTIQFSIYNHLISGAPTDTPSSAGPLLWTETRDGSSGSCPKVQPDAQGYFTVNLGSCVSFPSYLDFSTGTYYLAVKIDTDDEASPRVILATHPYAFNSDRVDGFHASSTAVANTLLALDDNLNLDILSGGFSGANFSMGSSTATSSITGNLSVVGNATMATATIANLILTGASSFGTISAGTWQGDIIATNYGGTGQNTSDWTGFVKINNGVWSTSTVNLTSDIAGILPIANGGTNANSFTNNEFIWFNGASLVGSGFTSSSFMSSSTDNWVDITGDTMSGALIINNNLSVTGTSTLATSTISRLMVGNGLPADIPSDLNFNFASYKNYNHLNNTGDGFEVGNILGIELNPDEDASTTINTLFNVTTNANNDKNFDVLAGVLNQVQHYGSGNVGILFGQLFGVDLETPTGSIGLAVGIQGAVSNGIDDVSYNGIIGSAVGVSGNIENGMGGGTIGYASAFQSNFSVENGNIGTAHGMKIYNPTGSASGTINNLYGLYIEQQDFADTSNFNIYSDGSTSVNYFGGKVGIGTSSPLSALDVYGNLSITGLNRYVNFGSATGTDGYGIRDNSGVMQWKNASGQWNNFSTKINHIVNVAKSGGDFDNLEDAVAFANSVDYDTIINIYPGVYEVSSTLLVTSTHIKSIRGMSREAVIIRPTSDMVTSPGPVFEIDFPEENDFSIRLLTIDGSQTAGFQNTVGCDAIKINSTGSVWMDFSELIFIETEIGIDMQVANLLNIFKTDFYRIGNIGVNLDNGASAQVENVYMEDVENRFVHLKSTTGSSSFYMAGSEFGSNNGLGTGLFIEDDNSYAEIRYSNMWGLDYNIITNNNSHTKVTASYLQKAATLNIDQKDSSAINISSSDGAFSSSDININDPTNVYFYALAEEEGVVLFGRHSNINQDIIKIDTGMAILPKLSYQADYYRNNGLIFVNDNPGERTMLGVQATSSEAKLSAISGDRNAIAGLYLYSDTDGFGSTSSMRGWLVGKTGENSNLLFGFYNNDSGDAKSLIDDKMMTLDGFNSQLFLRGGAVFNTSSGNYDFQVKTPDNDYTLFVQGSSDNVGIGTSTPDSQLTVDGDINITGSYLMNGTPLTPVDPGITQGQIAYWDGDSWAPTSNIFVSSSGFIGIGTTTPKNALTLIGGLSICSTSPAVTAYTLYNLGGQLYWNGSPVIGGNTSTYIQDSDRDTKVETEASPNENRIHFQTAGIERIVIDENGLIAINTTTENGKAFYVYGDTNNEFNLAIHNNNSGVSSTAEFSLYNDLGKLGGLTALSSNWNDGLPGISGVMALYSVSDLFFSTMASGGDIIFDIDPTDEQRSLIINGTNGYVGIATSTPLAPLSVNGNIFIEGENRYINFGTTTGAAGYGFRDNNGIMELRNINNNHNIWSEIVINDALIEGNIIYVNAVSGKDGFDGKSPARAKKTIQNAIDAAALLSSSTNPYTVSVSAGTFTEDLDMKDFVVVKGAGCNTFVVGKVTFAMTYGSVLSMVNLKNYDDYAVEIKSAGKSVLKNVEVGAEYTDDSKNIQAVIYQENGTLESFTANKYNFTQDHSTAGTKINTIFYITSSTIANAYVYNPEIFVNTYDSDDELSVLYTDNKSFRSIATIKDAIVTFPIYASFPSNKIKMFNHENARFNTYVDAAFVTALTVSPGSVELMPAYVNSSTVLSGVQITNSSFAWAGPGISENDVYLSSANTINDHIVLTSNQFKTDTDIFPVRYTADGVSGTVEYFISNGHGDLQNLSFSTYEGSFGIGTSTPYDLLEVWGSDLSSTASSSRNYITIVANGNGEAGHYVRRVNSGSYDNGWSWYMPTSSLDFRLWDDSVGAEGDDVLTIQAGTGYVGIGQALYDPLNKLHVDGGIYIGDTASATTTNSIYNIGGDLYWNGNLLASAGGATANWLLTSHNGGNVLTTSTTLPVWFKDIIYASSSLYVDGTLNVLGNSTLATTTISDLTVNNINVLGTVSTTDILVADSITLGGVTRNTWPTGGGGDSVWTTTTENVAYPDLAGNYAVVIGNSATSSNVKFEVLGNTKLGGDVLITGKNNVTGTSTLTGPVLFGDYVQFSTVGNNNLYFNNNTNNYLRWNNSATQFELSNGLSITGGVSTTGNMYAGNGFDTNDTYRMNGVDYGQFFIDSAGTAGQLWSSDSIGRGQWVSTSSLGLAQGIAGAIQFNDGNGVFSATSNLFWDNSNGRLGIGTTTPGAPLHVVTDNSGPAMTILQKTIAGATNLNFVTQNNKYWQLSKRDDNQDDKFIFYFVNDAGLFTNILTLGSTGTIGINNENPEAMLGIKGTSTYPLFYVQTSSSQPSIYSAENGYVGIGTKSPTSLLTISGTTTARNIIPANGSYNLGNFDHNWLRLWAKTININNQNSIGAIESTGSYGPTSTNINGALAITDPDNPNRTGRYMDTYNIATLFPGIPNGSNMTVSITSGNFDTYLQITSDTGSVTYFDDDGGTGTNSYLEFIYDASSTYNIVVTSWGAGETGDYSLEVTAVNSPVDAGLAIYNAINGGGDNLFTILNGGTVGIGTSTPSHLLTLAANNEGVLLITNSSTGYILLEGKYLSQNFGMSLETGALIAKNSYFGEEFMRGRGNVTADTLYAWGDFQQFTVDENKACTWSSVANGVNGIGRQQAANGANSCLAYHGITTAGTANLVFNTANLPVITFKASPSAVTANIRFRIGLSNLSQAQTADPLNGVYFTNNTTNGEWQGVSRRAGASTVVDCAGQAINTAVFGVAKIEVVSSNGDGTGEINFYIDNDATDGVDWFYCGQATTNIPTVGLTSMIMNNTVAGGGAQQIDIDYYRVWQDDSAETVIEEIVEEIPEYIEKNIFGMAQIKAGDSLVQVDFDGEYAVPPMMGVTPLGFDGRWKLQNVTTRGFEISLVEQAIDNVLFNWQAYVVEDDTKIHSSDGSIQLLKDFYLDFNPLINIPQSGSSGESTPAMPSGTSTPPVEETPPVETPTEPVIETPPVEEPAPAPEEPPVEDPVDPVETPVDVPVE